MTVTVTVHAEHTVNDLVERKSTAVLVRVVSERRLSMDAYLIDIHFRRGNICWILFTPSDAQFCLCRSPFHNDEQANQ